jgi:serine/threonine protein phosphatase PrpC
MQEPAPSDRRAFGTQPLDEAQTPDDAPDTRPLRLPDTLSPATQPLDPATPAASAAAALPPPVRVAAQLVAAGLRDIGRVRRVNQDHIYALTSTLPREEQDALLGLFVVADGMGGHDGGEVASRLAVAAVVRHILGELLVPAVDGEVRVALQPLLVAAIQEANRAIWDQARAVGSDMGTTCTVTLLLGHMLYIGHVGDSRAYLIDQHGIRVLTEDHSAVGRLISVGQLDTSEAREHPLRSQLYRTVGQHPEVAVDVTVEPVDGATHLLLCSDGLWSLVEDEALRAAVIGAHDPQAACVQLIDLANAAGGDDNIAAVVVRLPVTG